MNMNEVAYAEIAVQFYYSAVYRYYSHASCSSAKTSFKEKNKLLLII